MAILVSIGGFTNQHRFHCGHSTTLAVVKHGVFRHWQMVLTDFSKRETIEINPAPARNLDRAFLSKIEGGKKQPSLGLVANIAQGLKMRYARLVQNCEKCAGNEKSA